MRKKGGKQLEDQKIVALFFERNENAIARLSEKYEKTCKKIAFNVLRNESDAEECVNDAYLAVWEAIPPKKPDSLSAFLYRIVRNIATVRYHKNTAQKRNGFYDVALDELEECLSDGDAFETLETSALSRLFNEFLAMQKQEDRVIFVQRYWYAESVSEIAAELGKTSHFVSVKLSRIREKLKKFLIQKGYYV